MGEQKAINHDKSMVTEFGRFSLSAQTLSIGRFFILHCLDSARHMLSARSRSSLARVSIWPGLRAVRGSQYAQWKASRGNSTGAAWHWFIMRS